MDTLTNLKTFLAVARTGSFAGAARQLQVAPSVVTKRVNQIEWALKTTLFERTTRHVSLTAAGRRFLPAVQQAVADVDDIFSVARHASDSLHGHLRVKVPTSLAVMHVGHMLNGFQRQHPGVTLEVIALDRVVNPVDEAFDLAITVVPSSFGGVIDEPLCPLQRVACASPGYLLRRGHPQHPGDLSDHDLLHFLPSGSHWAFDSATGSIAVEVRPQFSTNEAQLLLAAALNGNGVAVLSEYLIAEHLAAGRLQVVLEAFPLPPVWLHALIPAGRLQFARVQALLDWLKRCFSPPPWKGLAASPTRAAGDAD